VKRLLFLLLLSGCDQPAAPPPAATREFTDDRGKTVLIPWPPKRIVSIVPSATELLFAVGAGEQVVGITTWCDWPPEAQSKEKVGNLNVDFERIAALRPDLIVTSWEVAKKATLELEAKGYAVYSIDPRSFEGIAGALRRLGAITDRDAQGGHAAAALEARVAAVQGGAGPTFYFEHSFDPLGSTGPESYAGDALRRAGGRNILEGGWRLIDWEIVMKADPEVILIGHHRKEALERRAGWAALRAVRNGRVHFVTKDHFVYPTPRLATGLEEAARIFHAKNP
jgi:iron complex transport system substrate-binding protein